MANTKIEDLEIDPGVNYRIKLEKRIRELKEENERVVLNYSREYNNRLALSKENKRLKELLNELEETIKLQECTISNYRKTHSKMVETMVEESNKLKKENERLKNKLEPSCENCHLYDHSLGFCVLNELPKECMEWLEGSK